ncbi:MAG: hypothetical protein ABS45_10700 [Comamonas sp. SCN 65-56]|uniref:multicopper oxidase family protein n=1 Tax=Comamonas sp. SCN 65-56 TaxID=1660095 RepID=UPI00086A1035|nr:multicopper oxidase domain-containing protein [Comamonas sp. SCN 65-56]ODS91558.1 MAG: hypothetical protein ABS45_10700 [Comamonas sp. SCN 65-56]
MRTTTPSLQDPDRRNVLRWAAGLCAGYAVTQISACSASGTPDTLPEPTNLKASSGLLELTLTASYAPRDLMATTDPQAAWPGQASRIQTSLRSYNGASPAPTLHLNQGDTLRVKLVNDLPTNIAGQSSLGYLNYQNSTNLHFHGLHVDPKEIRPGVFGDYVVDTAEAGVRPGSSRQHEITLPLDHTNGIYWYHPHLHGATNIQVNNGMFGAIIVHDAKDRFAQSPDIRERVIFVHKMNLNAKGRSDTFYDAMVYTPTAFMLNGAYQPTIVMRPGEVQNWHFINSDSFYPFNPVLDEHTLWHYARDGNVFAKKFRSINLETSTQYQGTQWPGNLMYPGNRHSVIVQASSTPGTYFLRSMKAPSSDRDSEEIVARIVVEGEPMSTALPRAQDLPVYAEHRPITNEELASGGGQTRNLVLAVLRKGHPRLASPIPAGEEWFIPPEDGKNDNADFAFTAGIAGQGLAPVQSSLSVTQTVALGAVEEWTIQSMNFYPHPFHIHVNDAWVVKVNGEAVEPYWTDTIPILWGGSSDKPTSITFRMRFTDFTGKFVWHCHALDHEDMGMMELVEVVA